MDCLQLVKCFDISDLFLPHNSSHMPETEMVQCFSCLKEKLTETLAVNHLADVIRFLSGIPGPRI